MCAAAIKFPLLFLISFAFFFYEALNGSLSFSAVFLLSILCQNVAFVYVCTSPSDQTNSKGSNYILCVLGTLELHFSSVI